jgi:hypothetical protein
MLNVFIADQSLSFKPYQLDPSKSHGAGIAALLGFKPADFPVVMAILANGELETVRADEPVQVSVGQDQFLVIASDRLYRMSIDGTFFEWSCPVISGAQVRKLGQIDQAKTLYLERVDQLDLELENKDLVDLDGAGVETFRSRAAEWKLEVQGVDITSPTSSIVVKDALVKAGFDPAERWQIIFVVKGKPKEKVTLETVIDLSAPGIERLRLKPDEVVNAEAPLPPKREFTLDAADEERLNRLGLKWETIVEGGRHFVVVRNYPLPEGYTAKSFLLAMEIPGMFPQSPIYGFFAHPRLALASGREIPNVSQAAVILGQPVAGWSRQRTAPPWNPATDSVRTHLLTVNECLEKEVE